MTLSSGHDQKSVQGHRSSEESTAESDDKVMQGLVKVNNWSDVPNRAEVNVIMTPSSYSTARVI